MIRTHGETKNNENIVTSHLNLNKHQLIKLFLYCESVRCEGVGENVVFSGDYKVSIRKFGEEDDINSDQDG